MSKRLRGLLASALTVALSAGAYTAIAPEGTGIPVAWAAHGVIADDGTREVDFTEGWKFNLRHTHPQGGRRSIATPTTASSTS